MGMKRKKKKLFVSEINDKWDGGTVKEGKISLYYSLTYQYDSHQSASMKTTYTTKTNIRKNFTEEGKDLELFSCHVLDATRDIPEPAQTESRQRRRHRRYAAT